ncbi:MAG: hypothetical protein AB7P33_14815 [Dehalococcoidia bacterium]
MTRIDTDDALRDLVYDGYSWFWYFDSAWLSTGCFWRVVKDGRVFAASIDHGETFGRSTAVDLTSKLRQELDGVRLQHVDLDDETGDVTLHFGDRFQVQLFISSLGYESYDLIVGGKNYVGMGSSHVAVKEWSGPLPGRLPAGPRQN